MASTNPARGMRDFLPADVRKRNYVIGIIKEVYESYGFEPLETPSVENLETLMGKYGDEGNQLVFKILKRGDKLRQETGDGRQELKESDLADLALRYDLTVPLARVVANNKNDLPKFFKRYQIQPVWRADRPARGRFREFYQCDVDCIGSESVVAEAEMSLAVGEVLLRLKFEDFRIRLNHRGVLRAMLETVGIPEHQHVSAITIFDKLDKIGFDGIEEELDKGEIVSGKIQILSFLQECSKRALEIIAEKKDLIERYSFDDAHKELIASINHGVLDQISGFVSGHSEGQRAVNELRNIVNFAKHGSSSVFIDIDPTLARGLSYYTGTIMEINVPDLAGSLGGGGRYDGLIGMFGKEQIPACGFSLGLERILVVMEERGMFPPEIAESTPADVMVTIWNEETIADSLKLANELRSQGLRVTLYPEPDKLGKQFKYADQINVPFVCVIGEAELADGTVTIKNLKTGVQETIERSKAAERLK